MLGNLLSAEAGGGMAIADLLQFCTSVITSTLEWVHMSVDCITERPFLLITIGLLMLGGAVGMINRLLSRG